MAKHAKHDWLITVIHKETAEGWQPISQKCSGCGASRRTLRRAIGEMETLYTDPQPLPADCARVLPELTEQQKQVAKDYDAATLQLGIARHNGDPQEIRRADLILDVYEKEIARLGIEWSVNQWQWVTRQWVTRQRMAALALQGDAKPPAHVESPVREDMAIRVGGSAGRTARKTKGCLWVISLGLAVIGGLLCG